MKNKKTPSQYGTEANFLGIAKDYNHFRLIDGVEEGKILFIKPLASNQTKELHNSTKLKTKKENFTKEKVEKQKEIKLSDLEYNEEENALLDFIKNKQKSTTEIKFNAERR